MKKIDMSQMHRRELQAFLGTLTMAGWEVEDWQEVLDRGADIFPEAEATYRGPFFDQRLEYRAEENCLIFENSRKGGELFLSLHLYPKYALEPVLGKIIQTQNTIDNENFVDLVKSLIDLCDPVLIEMEEGRQRLSNV